MANKQSGTNTARRQGGPGRPFVKGDLRRNNAGQRNKAAVALTRSFRNVLVLIGGESLVSELQGKPISKQKIEWLGQKLWAMALSGDLTAIRELLDRMEGKVTQPIGGTPDGAHIRVRLEKVITTINPNGSASSGE